MATQGQWQGQWGGQWFGPTEPAPPGSMSGSALLSFSATGELTAGNSGFMSGSASLSFSAAGALGGVGHLSGSALLSFSAVCGVAAAPGSVIEQYMVAGGGGYGDADLLAKRRRANEHEARISRQNELILALVMAAVTEELI